MLRACFWPVALLGWGLTAVAQPVVSSVVDPATFTITRFTLGELVTLFGTGLGTSPSVTVDGKAAYIIYASDSQINMQLPVNIATGTRDVVVTNGTSSQPFPLTIVTYSPVILFYNSSTPTITHADGTLVSSSKPAVPDEYLKVYALGLGPVTMQPPTGSPGPTNPLSNTTTPVTVTFGGQVIAAYAAYLSPTGPGTYEVIFRVPPGLASGDVQMALTVGGASSNVALLPYSNVVALGFVTVSPCRIADTRNATGAFGGPSIAGGSSRSFVIPESACVIPTTAVAYSVNVTVVPKGLLGYITVWPTGQPQPVVSTLNSLDGRIKSNAAIVPTGGGGGISVYASDDTDVILDIDGYFVPPGNGSTLAWYPLAPCRVVDTRGTTGTLSGPALQAGQSRTFPIQAGSCTVPSGAQAYTLNFTAVPSGPLGYITTWPTGQPKPVVSTLNALTGAITANAAIVPAGTSGSIDVYASNRTDLIIDINGYFAPAGTGGLSLYTVTPCRVLDTREPAGSPPISAQIDVNVSGSACAPPSTAEGYVLNATVVPPAPLGYITLWPKGGTRPTVSTLNALDGAITSNMAIVGATLGKISAYPSSATHLILDISSYFAP